MDLWILDVAICKRCSSATALARAMTERRMRDGQVVVNNVAAAVHRLQSDWVAECLAGAKLGYEIWKLVGAAPADGGICMDTV